MNEFNWVVHCNWDHPEDECDPSHHHSKIPSPPSYQPAQSLAPDSYNVYAIPAESPNHGGRSIVSNPADLTASPFGWHDTNGAAGAEFTITRGNNVWAQDDQNGNNGTGFSPDGGATLDFDFPVNLNNAPSTYLSASVTNLFYLNNIMHDVFYQYGFDEVSGNFQDNNYGNGGSSGDYVFADGQDGGGTNNANFSTPPDGSNGRMQMFLWTGGTASANFIVNGPASVAGSYFAVEAAFGPALTGTPITGNVVEVSDGTVSPSEGCNTLINGADLNGNIALVDRGNCPFVDKVQNAQDAGAIAVIVCNNVAGSPITMGGTSGTITIPSVMISQSDCQTLRATIPLLNVSLSGNAGNVDRDGSFDNGIIAHEYTHGISIRLTGGPSNSNCLSNAEQAGEGWSDWYGLVLTVEPGDSGTDVRGIGTFAINEPTTGNGIRPFPYSTDLNVNPMTYATINNTASISQPHGVGSVWCTMIWDLYWKFVEQYGWDPDVYNGTGGNNMAIQLVTDGLKLQPCSPGFVDSRDAILQADVVNYGGANQCLIWEVFARRGLGFSADQGSSASRTDAIEAFDTPSFCTAPVAPVAGFSGNDTLTCDGTVTFTDESLNFPTSRFWDFGDGSTSTAINPTHTYLADGQYTVTLIVTNSIGNDTVTKIAYITVDRPDGPIVTPFTQICGPQNVTITSTGSSNTVWSDTTGTPLVTGSTFSGLIFSTTTLNVVDEIQTPIQNVGPVDNTIGTGANFTNTAQSLIFDVQTEVILESVQVFAASAGSRIIEFRASNGTVIDSRTVNIPTGASRVTLNFEMSPGTDYQLGVGGTFLDLYRNNSGTNYPYTLPGLVSITRSTASSNPVGFYYFFYDWEVREPSCFTEPSTTVIDVVPAGNTPVANFNFVANGTTVSFTDSSVFGSDLNWDFGDGTVSTQTNPVHTFSIDSTFTICLTTSNICGSDISCQTIELAIDCNPDGYEPNDTKSAAVSNSGLISGSFAKRYICPRLDEDWFEVFNLKSGTDIIVELQNLPANFDLELHDATSLLASSTNSSLNDEQIIFSNAPIGTYYVRVFGANGAFHESEPYHLTIKTILPNPGIGIGTKPNVSNPVFKSVNFVDARIQLYPNPASQNVFISLPQGIKGDFKIRLVDVLGKVIKVGSFSIESLKTTYELNLEAVPSGMYFIDIQQGNIIRTEKLIVAE